MPKVPDGKAKEDANKESRKKDQAKSSKVTIHGEIAQFVFSGDRDPVIHSTLKANPGRFAKAVDNHIASLKKKYRQSCTTLGHTGAGLTFDQLEGNPNYKGPIGAFLRVITTKFKIFNRLHGFWRKIPNYNLFTTSSDPDQDHEAQAFNMLFPNKRSRSRADHHAASEPAMQVHNQLPQQPLPQSHGYEDYQHFQNDNFVHQPFNQFAQFSQIPPHINHHSSSLANSGMVSSASSLPNNSSLPSLPPIATDPSFFDPNAASLFPEAYHQSLSSLFQTNHSSHSFVRDVPFQDIPFQLPSSPVSGSVSGHSGFFMNQAPASPASGHSSFYASVPPGSPSSGQSGFSANPSANLVPLSPNPGFFANLPPSSPISRLASPPPPVPSKLTATAPAKIVKSGKRPSAVTVRETLRAQLATSSGNKVSTERLITTDRRVSTKDAGTPQSAKVDDRPRKQPRSHIEDNVSLMQKVMEPVAQAMQGQQSLAQEALQVKGGKVAARHAKYMAIAERACSDRRSKDKEATVLEHEQFKEKLQLVNRSQVQREQEQRQHEKDMFEMKFKLIQAVKDIPGVDSSIISSLLANNSTSPAPSSLVSNFFEQSISGPVASSSTSVSTSAFNSRALDNYKDYSGDDDADDDADDNEDSMAVDGGLYE
ncbi:hypothetical protein SERLADRAFT_443023 [Serpula lacrymans var. lacrymans S7.9]|uniref:Uncharacterized protein n=1 Tax=Serpula lacrymans var. lacrymans (strain S7.9) TaxID=578457 RepID=F8PBB8_SERL9|nr:uncharacterized protein SERLADRAFT_443023 [Serpula lacrymans var. lacrymans S7.9]EGO19558.1 hypothetical protein SERLADRAFT_443023 [Serpula lacrymans var. lacrymans S7.9]